jgi:hypothetical protein
MSNSIEEKCKGKNISTIMKYIKSKTIDLNNDNLKYLLHYSISSKENPKSVEELIKYLIGKKTILNSIIFYDFLFTLCEQGKINLVKIFLDNDLMINCQNEEGKTPMHIAVEKNNYPLVNLLMSYSPDLTLYTYNDFLTVYNYAENCKNNKIKSLILGNYNSNNIDSLNSFSKSSNNILNYESRIKKMKTININLIKDKRHIKNYYQPRSTHAYIIKRKNYSEKLKKASKVLDKNYMHQISFNMNKNGSHKNFKEEKRNTISKKIQNTSFNCLNNDNINLSFNEKCKKLLVTNKKKNKSTKYTTTNLEEKSKIEIFDKTDDIFTNASEFNDSSIIKNKPLILDIYKNNEYYFKETIDNSGHSPVSSSNTNENGNFIISSVLENKKEKKLISFFEEIHLTRDYVKKFMENGFDDLDVLVSKTKKGNVITDEILKKIGIQYPGHRAKIIIHLEEIAQLYKFKLEKEIIYMAETNSKYTDYIYKFLASINLEEYVNNFILNGYLSPQLMFMQMVTRQPITDNILQNDIGIKKIGYRARILNSLKTEANIYIKKLKNNGNDNALTFENSKNINSCEVCHIF